MAWAARLYGKARAVREQAAYSEPLTNCLGYQQSVAACRAALGEADYQAKEDEGRSLSLDEALAYPLDSHN